MEKREWLERNQILAYAVALVVGRLLRLNSGNGRVLIFSSFTRNSLLVLPLALPGEAAGIAAAVIVAQTMLNGSASWLMWGSYLSCYGGADYAAS